MWSRLVPLLCLPQLQLTLLLRLLLLFLLLHLGENFLLLPMRVSLELRWMPPQDRLPMQLLMILMEVRIFPLQQGEKDGLGQSVKVVCSQTHSSSRFSGFLPGFVKYFGSRTTSPIVKRGGLGVFVLCYGFFFLKFSSFFLFFFNLKWPGCKMYVLSLMVRVGGNTD